MAHLVTSVAIALAFIAAAASPAMADELDDMKEKVQQYTLKLADLEKADVEMRAIKDIKLAQLWLNEAQAQIVKEEEDPAKLNLRRVGVALDMIAALIDRSKLEKQASDRESAAIKMEDEAREAKIALEQAEARKKQLQTESN